MDGRNDTAVEALLEHLIEHGPGDIATVFGRAFELAMRIERERFLRAGPYERTAERQGYANGYKPKRIDTPAGTVTVDVPKTAGHDGAPFYPQSLERGRRSVRAVMLAVAEMYVKGVSTRDVEAVMREFGIESLFLGRSRHTATPDDLRAYQLHMTDAGVTPPTFNARIMALRFLFGTTCKREEMQQHMRFRRQPRRLPVVLSVQDVSEVLAAAPGPGLKYRAALSISYGGGLRAAEVCALKIGDIDSGRMLIHVEQGKGRKDRKVMLSPHLLELLRAYWREARPAGWLFPGKPRINPISPRQLSRAFLTAKAWLASPGRPPCIPSATASPPIFWRRTPMCG